MGTMQSRFAGRCACGAGFGKGATINYDRGARRVIQCPTCNPTAEALAPRWDTGRPNDRYQSNHYRFAGGGEAFQNKAGRCEDAPCCGCCS